MFVKGLVLFGIGKISKLSLSQIMIFTFALCQTGEFAFVLFSLLHQLGISDSHLTSVMMTVTAITITLTPMLLLINEKWIQSKIEQSKLESNPHPSEGDHAWDS